MSSAESLSTHGRARLSFASEADIDEFVATLERYERGELTRVKSIVVSRATCAEASESLGLEEFLILGKGMTTSPKVPRSVLSDVFEALIAAIYLDGGLEAARGFILRNWQSRAASEQGGRRDAKTELQEWAHANFASTPVYRIDERTGPDHDPRSCLFPISLR